MLDVRRGAIFGRRGPASIGPPSAHSTRPSMSAHTTPEPCVITPMRSTVAQPASAHGSRGRSRRSRLRRSAACAPHRPRGRAARRANMSRATSCPKRGSVAKRLHGASVAIDSSSRGRSASVPRRTIDDVGFGSRKHRRRATVIATSTRRCPNVSHRGTRCRRRPARVRRRGRRSRGHSASSSIVRTGRVGRCALEVGAGQSEPEERRSAHERFRRPAHRTDGISRRLDDRRRQNRRGPGRRRTRRPGGGDRGAGPTGEVLDGP